MSVWCTPGRPAVLRRHVLPQRRSARDAVVRARVRSGCRGLARTQRDEVLEHARTAHRGDRRTGHAARRPRSTLSPQLLARGLRQRRRRSSSRATAASVRAPKFPQAMTLDFLCRAYDRNASPQTLEMITTTLDAMAAGGIYDQLGGGFARYSTDDFWLVPHFEKMLYDNALLDPRVPARRISSPASRGTSASSKRRSSTCCATSATRTAGSTPPRTPTPKASRASSTSGASTRSREVCGDDADEVIRYYGVTEAGNFVDPHTQYSAEHPARRRPHRGAVGRGAARPATGLLDAPRPPHPARPRRQGPARRGTRCSSQCAHRSRGRARPRRLDGRGPRPTRGSCSRELRSDATAASSARGGAPYLAYAEDYAALLEALCSLAEHDDASWLDDARAGRRRPDPAVRRRDGRRLLHDRPRRRAPRRPAEGRLRRRDAVGQLARRERTAAVRRAHRRSPLRGAGAEGARHARPRR